MNNLQKLTTDALVLWNPGYALAEENCACSEVHPQITFQPTTVGAWRRATDLYTDRLPIENRLVFNPLGPAGPVVLNDTAWRILDSYQQPGQLQNQTAHTLAQLGLLQPVDAPDTLPEGRSETLTAWLHVTNACNLRCTYCYVEKTEEAMSEETGKAAIRAIFRSATQNGFKTVKLKYAGGEATLNFGLVQKLHGYARQLADQMGMNLQGVVLSNGVALSRPMLKFISEQGLNLMISLDGGEDEHDTQRTFINGQGSYRHVTRSVDRALEHGVSPHLSITVTGQSVAGVAQAVNFALERDLLFNLNFYRDHTPEMSQDQLRAQDDQLITALRSAFSIMRKRPPRRSIIGSLVDRSNFAGPHRHSCGAGHDYMVIDHEGGVSRCQMEIEHTVTDVMAADPLAFIREEKGSFQNVAVEEKEGCRSCEWRYWCAGGCSLLTHRVTGRSDVKSPYCNVYKTIYPELLQLEGLRLLQWQDAEAL